MDRLGSGRFARSHADLSAWPRYSAVLEVQAKGDATLLAINQVLLRLLRSVDVTLHWPYWFRYFWEKLAGTLSSRREAAPGAVARWVYRFACEAGLESMQVAFNCSGPWKWEIRDSDFYGNFLTTQPCPGIRVHILSDAETRYFFLSRRTRWSSRWPICALLGRSRYPTASRLDLRQTPQSSSWEWIGDHAKGPLIVVRFAGVVPIGTRSIHFARSMGASLRSALAQRNAAGVILDLKEVDYLWGDGICDLAWALYDKENGFRSAMIVATGETAIALGPLCQPRWVLGLAGMKIFPTVKEARAELERKLEGRI